MELEHVFGPQASYLESTLPCSLYYMRMSTYEEKKRRSTMFQELGHLALCSLTHRTLGDAQGIPCKLFLLSLERARKKRPTGAVGTRKLMSAGGCPSAQPEEAPCWVLSPISSPRMLKLCRTPKS